MVYADGKPAPPDAEVRKKLMMFRPGRTHLSEKKLSGSSEGIRRSLVGNSFHVGVKAYLLRHWAAAIGLMPRAPTAQMIADGTCGFAEVYDPHRAKEQARRLSSQGE